MAKGNLVKCPKCKKENEKSETMQIGTRYYCLECGEQRQEEIDKHNDGWDELFEYICKLYGIKKPTPMMFKQIKDFRVEPYEFTNKGMYLTLKYYHELLGNSVLEGSGIGIIPYYYEKAKKHYIEVKNIKKHILDFEHEEVNRVVCINNPNKETALKNKQLPFENISWED